MNDPAWYDDPRVLANRPLEFFPARGMTPAERLNSMVRFVAYASVGIAIYRNDPHSLLIGAVVIVVISTLRGVSSRPANKTTTRGTYYSGPAECTVPTPDNPFANVLASEYMENKPAACRVTTETMNASQAYFDRGLIREISDVYKNRASDRQFVTMPATGDNGTPDTLAFRNYLYGPRQLDKKMS